MRKIILILLTLLNLSILASETVRLTSGEWAPYLSQKLNAGGFGAAIVTSAFKEVDVNVIYDYYP